MKSFYVLLLMVLSTSCTSYYYVMTEFGADLSVERTVYSYSEDGSDVLPYFASGQDWRYSRLEEPFEVDFYDERVEMTGMSVMQCDDISEFRYLIDEGHEVDPLFSPVEKASVRFRWFYTYHDYSARFRSLEGQLPLPLDTYLHESSRELFFRGGKVPAAWNGVEMYLLLDDMNRRLAHWFSDAVYIVMCDAYEPYCTAVQRAFMDSSRKDFMERTQAEIMFVMEPEEFGQRMDGLDPDMGLAAVYKQNAAMIDASYEEQTKVLDYFSSSFIYSVDMSGDYFEGNATDFIDGLPAWKVDAYRLLAGDLVLEATFRKVNLWAFILTFAVIAAILQAFAKLFDRISRGMDGK